MTSAAIVLGRPEDATSPWLRLAGLADQEHLRSWRNANAIRFYHQEIVPPEAQRRWFEAYLERPDDYLFMVMAGDHAVGCIGLRFVNEAWDVYNVIRGVQARGSTGFMSLALGLVLAFARHTRPVPIVVEVLPDNPALRWYLANGFVVAEETPRCVRMIHQSQVRA
jgi:hypothetical protein